MVHPLSEKQILNFAKQFDMVYVLEELDSIIEDFCKANGIRVIGKELFSRLGEYTATEIKEKILHETPEYTEIKEKSANAPPSAVSWMSTPRRLLCAQ